MSEPKSTEGLFERRLIYPDVDCRTRLARLVGLDDQKARLTKILATLVNPDGLSTWLAKHHSDALPVLDWVLRRPPLVILAGDVGSGKTELAETIGDAVARQEDIEITLLPLSLASRGEGRVGEMTALVSAAFNQTAVEASKLKGKAGRAASGAVILLVDEADALAQSRESAQMHHEDRAGVNAFIRGIDRLANTKSPAAVIMCTNRLAALDPAVKRRAADILSFGRPNDLQRRSIVASAFEMLNLSDETVSAVVAATGQLADREYGFSFSDITQRLLPSIVLDAYPAGPVTDKRVVEITRAMQPTPPFREELS
jgi:AAA+ superfamily predicted ATPase